MRHFVILFLLQFCCIDVFSVSGQCLSDQKTLLLELKNNLTYDFAVSTKLVEWNQGSADCCFWAGVSCDSSGHVVELDLSWETISQGINETSSLFDLRFLQRLDLASNYLSSVTVLPLPESFQKLTSLQHLNLSNSGFVGQIPTAFSKLTTLVSLDLSVSSQPYSNLVLENPNLETIVQNLTLLRELYLDNTNISAPGDWCAALSSSVPELQVLSLADCGLSGPIDSSLGKLRSLSVLNLDSNDFTGQMIPAFLGDFRNLTVLRLSSCQFSGKAPEKIFQIPTLRNIDLSNNGDLQGTLPEFPANSSLQNLVLERTQFSGSLPNSIGNLRMLSQIQLRGCRFTGSIPSSVENLTNLVDVDLSENQLNGSIPSLNLSRNLNSVYLAGNKLSGSISFFQGSTLDNLVTLDLGNNSLEGNIPESLFFMPSLKHLTLSYNKFSGQISDVASSKPSKLDYIDLASNSLEGPLPRFLFDIQNLTSINLSWNRFNGTLDLTDFGKLSQLFDLDLSYNKLIVDTNRSYSEPSLLPQFSYLMLASCGLRNLPFLKNQSKIVMLDLSNNQIAGEIPSWLWEIGDIYFRTLNLSLNQLTGLQEPYNFRYLEYLDLHSNSLTGNLPTPPPNAGFVDFSSNNFGSSIPADTGNRLLRAKFYSIANNKVMGDIPESLCNASMLQVLDLSNNSLSNGIPTCFLQTSNFLGVLNLRRNNLSGLVPGNCSASSKLETYDLCWNRFEGQVPESLSSCSNLKVLNLGNNRINDEFPCWINRLTNLHVLILRNNTFHGAIACPENNYTWPSLQILDLAANSFNGSLPAVLFSSLKAMTMEASDQLNHLRFDTFLSTNFYYQDSVSLTLKGRETYLQKIISIFTSIDFSSNHFQGNLPETIGDLPKLYLLNLSHNALTGPIPPSIGNLSQMEALDLSFNNLSGEIPSQISGLTFLAFLNLAYNELAGRIPGGGQMQTFSASSFQGNDGLCGFPSNKNCRSPSPPSPDPAPYDDEGFVSATEIYISAAMGFAVSITVIYGSIFCNKKWRHWYITHLDILVVSILVQQDRSASKKKVKKIHN